ncbi:MAG: glycoside hydrolase family 2 protein [Puniceicoccaceae bacterium]
MKVLFQSVLLVLLVSQTLHAQEIVPAPIQTPWDSKVDEANVLPEYPRPQLVRDDWLNLNGLWNYAITEKGVPQPDQWNGDILVPFCFESELSGVNRIIQPDEWMWYQRRFTVPADWMGKRIWLNFEASDWETVVYVNGKRVGTHRNGYVPFSFDITNYLVKGKAQNLVVRVWDHSTTKLFSSGGKQGFGRPNVVYENTSGIWQTVWLEPRARGAIDRLEIRASYEQAKVTISAKTDGKTPSGSELRVQLLDGNKIVSESTSSFSSIVSLSVPDPKAWSPDHPFLYGMKIALIQDGKVLDQVESYCGLRDISIDKSLDGPQILLNGEPLFQFGPLDQGYWPLSVFTPPTEEALRWEVEYMKRAGCNMVRMHVKRNPSRWYYHCDKIGLLVWQDFVPNKTIKNPKDAGSELWKMEQIAIMDSLNNHPSLVKWIVFNEAWSQHKTEEIVNWIMGLAPDHIVTAASGWDDLNDLGDIRDLHDYSRFPSLTDPKLESSRAVVLGETGGFGINVPEHAWKEMPALRHPENLDGIVPFAERRGGMEPVNPCADNDYTSDIKRPVYTLEGFVDQYSRYIDLIRLEQAFGLSGAVYTQLTDMRHEQNGWLTFDRKLSKIPVEKMKEIHERLYRPVQQRKPILAAGSDWTAANGETIAFPFKPAGDTSYVEKKGQPKPIQEYDTYSVAFRVDDAPDKVALNVFLESQHGQDSWSYLKVYLDGTLILDDMSRHKKLENRITCLPLTQEQVDQLTVGEHELKILVANTIPIQSLDLSLDAVIGK